MLRQGMYTGKIYTEEDFQEFRIKECCVLILEENNTEEKNKKRHEKIHMKCLSCNGCPEAKAVTGQVKRIRRHKLHPLNPLYGLIKDKEYYRSHPFNLKNRGK